MRERILRFVEQLRDGGLRVSPAETLDAVRAAAAGGVERAVLREALAATVVKDHADREAFDAIFARYFALPPARRSARRAPPPSAGEGDGASRDGERAQAPRDQTPPTPAARPHTPRAPSAPRAQRSARRLAKRAAAARLPFRDMDPRAVELLPDLAAELSRRFRRRLSRRQRRAPHGRVDLRRTARLALSRGGVPLEIVLRRPRPRRVDLLALVDLSHSTATAAEFLLAAVAPARRHFRRVRLFGYVDGAAEIALQGGHVIPVEPLDLHARSDFGAVLRGWETRPHLGIGRNTVLLILGDARNNRRPPRADLLARLHGAARAVVWLNPEEPRRWNSGDSVMAAYAPHVDLLLAAWNAESLTRALDRVTRGMG